MTAQRLQVLGRLTQVGMVRTQHGGSLFRQRMAALGCHRLHHAMGIADQGHGHPGGHGGLGGGHTVGPVLQAHRPQAAKHGNVEWGTGINGGRRGLAAQKMAVGGGRALTLGRRTAKRGP